MSAAVTNYFDRTQATYDPLDNLIKTIVDYFLTDPVIAVQQSIHFLSKREKKYEGITGGIYVLWHPSHPAKINKAKTQLENLRIYDASNPVPAAIAALKVLQELFQKGTHWDETSINGSTLSMLAQQAGYQHKSDLRLLPSHADVFFIKLDMFIADAPQRAIEISKAGELPRPSPPIQVSTRSSKQIFS